MFQTKRCWRGTRLAFLFVEMKDQTSIRILILLVFWNSIAFGVPSAVPTDPEWDSLEISLDDLSLQLDQEVCAQGVRNVLGCLSAVNRWAYGLQIDIEFVPTRDIKKNKVLRIFNRLAMIKRQSRASYDERSPKAFLEFYRRSQQEFLGRYSAFAKQFKSKPGREFDDIVSYLRKASENSSPAALSKRQIAGIISEYLRIAFSPRDFWMSNISLEMRQRSEASSVVDYGFSGREITSGFLIQEVDSDSAAERAGMRAWDVITEVNGEILGQKPNGKKHLLLMGTPGKQLHLTIQRKIIDEDQVESWRSFPVSINQSVREMKSLVVSQYQAFNQKWMRLQFRQFNSDELCQQMAQTLRQGESEDVQGYLIDLRKNMGGATSPLPCLTGLFLGPGKTIYVIHGEEDKPVKSIGEALTQKPVVILQDAETASSAEIFAAALRDHRRALLVGNLSFGKGSFQNCFNHTLKPNLRRCYMGALVYSPAGGSFQNTGLTPDILSYAQGQPTEAELFPLREKDKYLFPVLVRAPKSPIREALDRHPLSVPHACLEKRRLDTLSERLVTTEILSDFQILTGLSTLSCLWPISTAHRTE